MKITRITRAFLGLSLLCSSLFIFRFLQTGELLGLGLVWNLFLAWLPLGFALIARRSITNKKITLLFLGLWLLFFPNAPYIITDLVHLKHLSDHLWWYDSLGIFLAAFTGLLLGIYSIQIAHNTFYVYFGKLKSWLIVIFCMGLSGFGIYLGRFSRLNSWEVVSDPLHLIKTSINALQNPMAFKTTMLFGVVLSVIYIAFSYVIKLENELE